MSADFWNGIIRSHADAQAKVSPGPDLATGWADARLSQAYELIDAVLRENRNPETDLDADLRSALEAVERADVELERLSK